MPVDLDGLRSRDREKFACANPTIIGIMTTTNAWDHYRDRFSIRRGSRRLFLNVRLKRKRVRIKGHTDTFNYCYRFLMSGRVSGNNNCYCLTSNLC